MASDGEVAFADYQAAREFFDPFAPQVTQMTLHCDQVRVQQSVPDVAIVGASYREVITMESAKEE